MFNFGLEPSGRRLLERPGHRWEDNIKVNVKIVKCCVGYKSLGPCEKEGTNS
jgi:hypothetical protein